VRTTALVAFVPPGTQPEGSSAVTLITGDRVFLTRLPDGTSQVAVTPGPGRSHIAFVQSSHARKGKEEIRVVPSDAAPLLAAGRLDPRLFNITALVHDGFGDSKRTSLPLILTNSSSAMHAHIMAVASSSQPLASISGHAAVIAKDNAGTFWSTLVGANAATKTTALLTTNATAKVWLDGVAYPLLDQSVPQIGTPTAWQLGLTGKGVTVALLDTGVKLDHPDLVGRIAEAKDFTGTQPTASDDVGHGTHCAGIIAGSGAASHGKYKGVAPEATLIEGKVCGTNSCSESAIIAGMEWAAPKARIVSMSLGSDDASNGADALSQAANNLTTQYGSLIVAAAGNHDSITTDGLQSVGAPAAADLVLAVASVTKQDTMSDFSNRGLRIGDYAVKPEIAAPGSNIVSTRAPGTPVGDISPVDDYYTTLSGTSMATPHVAGAAALLAQLHPEWKAAELKAALISTAKPLTGTTLADDGVGRVDVARAVTQKLYASTGTLSFGFVSWPHTVAPVAKTITYHNDGDEAVTLKLTVAVSALDGSTTPAPVGLFQVNASALTVPAHGSADATLTFNPSAFGSAGGLFGGMLSASDGTHLVDVAMDAYGELESYNLTVERVGYSASDTQGYVQAFNPATGDWPTIQYDGVNTSVLRLPKGTYDINQLDYAHSTDTPAGATIGATFASEPNVDLSADRTVTFDFRRRREVSASVDNRSAVTLFHGMLLTSKLGANFGGLSISSGDPNFVGLPFSKMYAIPTQKTVTGHDLQFVYHAIVADPTTTTPDAAQAFYPGSYNLIFHSEEKIPQQLSYRAHDWQLASIFTDYHAQDVSTFGLSLDFSSQPVGPIMGSYIPFPSRRLEFYTAESAIQWRHTRTFVAPNGDADNELASVPQSYSPGPRHVDWNSGPIGVALGPQGVLRAINTLGVFVFPFSPGAAEADHYRLFGFPSDDGVFGSTTLSYNGNTVTKRVPGFGLFVVPPEDTAYTLTVNATRKTPPQKTAHTLLGTQMSATWTFHSQAPASNTQAVAQSIMVVRASGLLDMNDVAPAGELYPLALTVERQMGAPASEVTGLSLEVSYDDGQTWQSAPLFTYREHGLALLAHPNAPGFVSLRLGAKDAAGNSVTHTTIRAYAIGPLK
jgi:subtilisin family serine protease